MQTLYNLEVQARHWDEAMALSSAALKTKAKTQDQFRADKSAMLLARATEAAAHGQADQSYLLTREAYEASPEFLPAILAYIPFLLRRDDRKKATRIIEKTWAKTPHPDLRDAWIKLAPDGKDRQAKYYLWLERLAATNPDHEDSHLMLAEAALAQGLIGEARSHVDAALLVRQSQNAYRLLAKLEERDGNSGAADIMRERQTTALQPRVWVERETGHVYPAWMPFAPPHNSFNTIIWDVPGSKTTRSPSLMLNGGVDPLQIIDSRAA